MLTLLHLISAVALLVWGTHIVRTGILRVYGARLRRVLGHNLNNRVAAFLAGTGVIALVQSSNATALLAGGFVADDHWHRFATLAVDGDQVGAAQAHRLDLHQHFIRSGRVKLDVLDLQGHAFGIWELSP